MLLKTGCMLQANKTVYKLVGNYEEVSSTPSFSRDVDLHISVICCLVLAFVEQTIIAMISSNSTDVYWKEKKQKLKISKK